MKYIKQKRELEYLGGKNRGGLGISSSQLINKSYCRNHTPGEISNFSRFVIFTMSEWSENNANNVNVFNEDDNLATMNENNHEQEDHDNNSFSHLIIFILPTKKLTLEEKLYSLFLLQTPTS